MDEREPMQAAEAEVEVGVVTHYWSELGVAGVHLTAPLDAGDHIHILGHTSDFEQNVGSMEIEHHTVAHAEPGEDVGIRVIDHVREHDKVYRSAAASDAGTGQNAL